MSCLSTYLASSLYYLVLIYKDWPKATNYSESQTRCKILISSVLCFLVSLSYLFTMFLYQAKAEYLKDTSIVLPVQINGKTRGTILVEEVCSEDDAFKLASLDEKISKYLIGKTIRKRIYVPGRILNVILDQQKVRT